MLRAYTVRATATALGVHPRTVRRWIAGGQAPGAYQTDTTAGPTWMLPLATVEDLRSRVARTVEVIPQVELPAPSPAAAIVPAAPAEPGGVGPLGVAFDTLGRALERAQDDALWWRCEALDARQQLEAARIEAEATRGELARLRQQAAELEATAAELRQQVERHNRPTVRLDQLRLLREA